jgi:membrane protease YdiL (CAAX protease family)
VQRWMSRAEGLEPQQTLNLWLAHLIVAVIMAPVVEEVFFRGLLMQGWALRWGTYPAVIASSALFAICHIELLGHFVFGVAMSLLYLRTRSLWVPIAAHGLNNLIASLGSLGGVLDPKHTEKPFTIASLQSEWVAGASCLALGIALLVLYYRTVWRRVPLRALLRGAVPYVASDDAPVESPTAA